MSEVTNPARCRRCGHLRAEHGAQYPRPCERLDYSWRCKCRAFMQVQRRPSPVDLTEMASRLASLAAGID